jgi:cbb3-type cytochrome oxidase maturation protein
VDILFLLIPLSVVLAIAIGAAFWMAVDGGQFDDLDGPAVRVVADDDRPPAEAPGDAPFDARQILPAGEGHTARVPKT